MVPRSHDSADPAAASRRRFLTRSTQVVGGGALALAFAAVPAADNSQAVAAATSDLDILNYALTLERLEAAFYTQGLARFSEKDFKHIGDFKGGHTDVYDYFKLIRDHEQTHVAKLVSVIQSLGGNPVGGCTYNFGYKDMEGFVKVAQALENTGVMAYDGAIGQIQSADLRTAGATIATVEARHASYLNLLNGAVPFPAAFDTPKTMAEILAIAGQFIVSCP